jgi:NhaP-type Na+/H+ or K+/H+ antiporter
VDDWTLATLAALLLAYAAVSRRLAHSVLTAPIVFVTAGLAVGVERLGWIDLGQGTSSVRLLAEATLTLVLFADASRIDLAALRREFTVPGRLLGIGLPLTIVAGTALALAVLPGLTFVEACLVAIVLAPTDAALGQAVVVDPRLPSRIRQGLNVESGLNDGICVPLLLVALAVTEAEEHTVGVHTAVTLVVEELGYGIVAGALAGIVGAALVRTTVPRRLVTDHWLQVVPVATAGLAYGIALPLGGSGFIAAFVAGLVFGAVRRTVGGEVAYLLDETANLFAAVTFVVFGAALLGPELGNVTWAIGAYAVLSLTVARMLPVAAAMLGSDARPPTVAYLGWFGPRGLASIVFAVTVLEGSSLDHIGVILTTAYATVGLSVFAHGLTARPLTNRYAAWYARARRATMESVPAAAQRWRVPTATPAVPRTGAEPGPPG